MNAVVGIIGAGKLGTTIGRAAADAGWQVLYHDAAASEIMAMTIETLVPDAKLVSLRELAAASDIVMLAIPFSLSENLGYAALDGKIVLDAMNHWAPVDGPVAALEGWDAGTSALVATRNPKMRLVKSLNHLGYHDYTSDARSPEVANRRGVAVATDDAEAGRAVARLVDDIGFEPVIVPFAKGKALEPGGEIFGHWVDAASLGKQLG